MVVRQVIGGVCVLPRAGFRDDRRVLIVRILRRAAEHHVLEEVREAALARLDLVARAGLHRDLQRDDVRESRRDHDHLEAVGERLFGRLERQDVGAGGLRLRGGERSKRCIQAEREARIARNRKVEVEREEKMKGKEDKILELLTQQAIKNIAPAEPAATKRPTAKKDDE